MPLLLQSLIKPEFTIEKYCEATSEWLKKVRRGRRLVVSFICTVANYEYGFYFYFGFYLDFYPYFSKQIGSCSRCVVCVVFLTYLDFSVCYKD